MSMNVEDVLFFEPEIVRRLNVIVDKVGSLAAASRILNVNDASVCQWLLYRSNPSLENRRKICTAYMALRHLPSKQKKYKYHPRKCTPTEYAAMKKLIEEQNKNVSDSCPQPMSTKSVNNECQ